MKIDKNEVPKEFQHLIPLAEQYGETDDFYRSELAEKLTEKDKECLIEFLEEYQYKLDDWLAGPEADGPTFSNGYLLFSALRMISEEI